MASKGDLRHLHGRRWPDYMLEFPHGYTYSAHPVACAASVATMKLLALRKMRRSACANWFFTLNRLFTASKGGARHVCDIRNFGPAAGLSIAPLPGEPAKRPSTFAMTMLDKGFYVRYGGDTIQLAPTFISTRLKLTGW